MTNITKLWKIFEKNYVIYYRNTSEVNIGPYKIALLLHPVCNKNVSHANLFDTYLCKPELAMSELMKKAAIGTL